MSILFKLLPFHRHLWEYSGKTKVIGNMVTGDARRICHSCGRLEYLVGSAIDDGSMRWSKYAV